MPGSRSESSLGTLVGIAVALVAVVGYVVFGWSFGESSGSVPFAIGALVAAVAVAWHLFGGE
jgi:hypothetical protein